MLHRTFVIFLIITILAFLFWSSLTLQNIFYETISRIKNYIIFYPFTGIVIFICLAVFSAMFSPFSSAPLVPIAITIWGDIFTIVLLLIGWLIGGSFTYLIGYYLNHPFVSRFYSLNKKVNYYRRRLSQQTEFLIVLLFRFSMPAEIPGYVLGIIRYDFLKYFLATFISEAFFAIITVYASEIFLEQKPFLFILVISIVFLIISMMFYFLRRKLK